MSQTRFTPGPWRVGTHGPNGCYTVGTQQGLMTAMVAHSVNEPGQKAQAIGDAHLIAAAPELYGALSELADLMQGAIEGDYKPDSFTLQPASEALAKARGEDQ